MLMHLRALPALLGTNLGFGPAGLEDHAGEIDVGARAPGKRLAGGGATVGEVEVRVDAPDELRDHVLRQAGVCACRTSLGALKASGDARGQLHTSSNPRKFFRWAFGDGT